MVAKIRTGDNVVVISGNFKKYVVRVVQMGKTVSRELCGGTHVQNTGMIGLFCITQCKSIASNTYRIEAVVADAALQYVRGLHKQLETLSQVAETPVANLKQYITKLKHNYATPTPQIVATKQQQISNYTLEYKETQHYTMRALMSESDAMIKDYSIVCLVNQSDDKLSLLLRFSNDTVQTLGAITTYTATLLQTLGSGQGGGKKPNISMCGGIEQKHKTLILTTLTELVKKAQL